MLELLRVFASPELHTAYWRKSTMGVGRNIHLIEGTPARRNVDERQRRPNYPRDVVPLAPLASSINYRRDVQHQIYAMDLE